MKSNAYTSKEQLLSYESFLENNKTCVKRTLKNRQNKDLDDDW